ncbi:hypothetical protein [Pseudomonas sp.]|uniref:hypothetical protein n=1 Tax=Pseudomonas sp. TaxID=306 RepID=UPI00258EFF86|nr:hypothetical protein [Pseudomonas sp.]
MTVVRDDVAKVLAAIQRLTSREVMVGIPATKAEREDGEPINNAQLGYIHEYGAPKANIPARPFLVPGVAEKKDAIAGRLKKAAKAAMDGNNTALESELNAAGLLGQNGARNQINNGPHEPLAERTLAARRARGREGDKPLIDTGQLRNSLTYVIRQKE